MRRPSIPLLTVLLLGAAAGGVAQETGDRVPASEMQELERRVEDFFEQYADAAVGPQKALRDLLAASPLNSRTEARDKLIDQVGKLESLYGKAAEHEVVTRRSFGRDLVLLRCVLKAERFPIVWHFYFYRAPETMPMSLLPRQWSLVEIRFDTNLEALAR
jgi:hypothetical protein